MRFSNGYPDIGKWSFVLGFSKDFMRGRDLGWKLFEFGIFSLHRHPPQGACLTRHHYRGFLIRFYVWLPFDSWS